jgi:hypothetical protein
LVGLEELGITVHVHEGKKGKKKKKKTEYFKKIYKTKTVI